MVVKSNTKKTLNFSFDLPDPKLLSNQIADLIREGIVSGKFALGGKLPEQELSSILKVSRTPIRQALHILELEGFIEMIPRRGAFVSQLNQKDAEELYQILGIIESFASEQLINNRTDLTPIEEILSRMAEQIEKKNSKGIIQANLGFHGTIVKMAENRKLLTIYNSARNPTRIYQSVGLSSQQDWMESLQDHRQIVEAIRRGDRESAVRLCTEHNRKRCLLVITRLFGSPSDPK